MRKKNEKKDKDKGETLVLTVPKGTVITQDLLIAKRRYPAWEKVSKWVAFLFLAVFPLFMLNAAKGSDENWYFTLSNNYWYYNITEVKITSFRVLTFLYMILCVMEISYDAYSLKVRQMRKEFNRLTGCLRLTFPQIFILAYLAWNGISALCSSYSFSVLWRGYELAQKADGIRTEGLYHTILYCALFLLLSFWGEYSGRHYCGMTVMSFIFCAIGILQMCGVPVLYPSGADFTSNFLSTVGNIDMVAGLAAVAVPALLCYYIISEHPKSYLTLIGAALMNLTTFLAGPDSYRVGLIGALIIAVPFLFDTKKHTVRTLVAMAALLASTAPAFSINAASRSCNLSKTTVAFAVLAVLCAVGAFVLSRTRKECTASPKKRRIIAAICIGAGCVVTLGFLFFVDITSNSLLHEVHELLHFRLSDNAGSNRGYAWKSTWTIIKENPIFGAGPGTFYYEFNPRFSEMEVYDMAHNDFLQIAAHTGFVGLALYLAFVGTLAARAIKAACRTPLVLPLACAAAAYLIHSFFSFSIAIISPMFWVVAGLLDKFVRQLPKEVEVTAPNSLGIQTADTAEADQ